MKKLPEINNILQQIINLNIKCGIISTVFGIIKPNLGMFNTSKISIITRQQSYSFINFWNFSNFLSCYFNFGSPLLTYFGENLHINWVK